ncbi:MAG: phytanoyl-CoA dioxygenase family protein [Proteobacteria bacterium]|nr:phytanoyl-CoA dioxygenase family protein [Pseudomonadota bacterium]MDA1355051.1 phytanoyl-CoA dioxygenase family protein [Pseudomonadota bacterium]
MTGASAAEFTADGRRVPAQLIGELIDSSDMLADPEALRASLLENGYLLLRGAIEPAAALAARREVLQRLAAAGEIDLPGETFSGNSQRPTSEPQAGEFLQSVCEGPRLREAIGNPNLADIISTVFGEPARGQDYVFLRVAVAGRGTATHCDFPFFTRATERVLTCWLGLSDLSFEQGGLYVVEGSHLWADHVAAMRGFDLERAKGERRATLTDDIVKFAEARRTRLLTTRFGVGDILLFSMYLIHGAFDNRAPSKPVRVSCDVRWQPISEPFDPRYMAPGLSGTFGGGYGELNAAKPLTEDWHKR